MTKKLHFHHFSKINNQVLAKRNKNKLNQASYISCTFTFVLMDVFVQQSQRSAPRLWVTPAQQRWASSLPMNTVVLFVPQQEAWVVERMGRFHRILEPVSVTSHLSVLDPAAETSDGAFCLCLCDRV